MKRASLLLLAALLCFVRPADATWSIVVVDTRTGEVAVASATCLANFELAAATPVLIVGQGAAASQSVIAPTSVLKDLRQGILAGYTPHQILAYYTALDGAQDRQVGIATMAGPAVSWSGIGAAPANPMRWGTVGSIHYAMQGNLLAGHPVVSEMEKTFVLEPGDLSQKLMAAMQTARRFGGDGRCSCDLPKAHQCGSPPENYGPDGKSAHTAFIHLARMGDTNGPCNGSVGCSAGDYYLDIEFNGGVNSDDPVIKLQKKLGEWREALIGRPDHLLSTVSPSAAVVAATDTAGVLVQVHLRDVEGVGLPGGGVQLSVESLSERPAHSSVGAIEDHGDGTYSFSVFAGSEPGLDQFAIWADDGIRPVRLHPPLRVRVAAPQALLAGAESVSASAPHAVGLQLDLSPLRARAAYAILGTESAGSGAFLDFTLRFANSSQLPATVGYLDGDGRASAAFDASPALLQSLVGTRLQWTAWALDPQTGQLLTTPATEFEVIP